MGFLDRIFRQTTKSADTAKERLQFVLAHDRSDISTETLEILKDEIVNVISNYVEIDREHVEVTITTDANISRLVANIPVLNTRRPRAPRRESARQAARPARAVRTKS